MLRCSLSYTKIVQIECRISSWLEYYAEMRPILCKDKILLSFNPQRVYKLFTIIRKLLMEVLFILKNKVFYLMCDLHAPPYGIFNAS